MSAADKKPRILIVDDTPENIHVLMETLRDEYALVAATSGKKALELAGSKQPPDLILLDIMMPEMDGYEVCRRLKADDRLREIPVIFVTAKAEEVDELKGFQLGAVDYITKPISPPKVLARVRTHITLKEARAKLERQNLELIEAARLREDVDRIMRHDLKTPLNAIVGISQLMLEDEDLPPENSEQLTIIEESGYRVLQMVNLSLDLMKMERNSYPFQPVPVDLMKVFGKILRECEPLAAAKQVTIRLAVDGQIPDAGTRFLIKGEELLCYSMLANLLKNSVEASPENGTVAVDLRHAEEQGEIHIHNKGAVPEAIRDRFFEKYVTEGKSGGTGLGTYSARLIAETQGGTVGLETSDTAGTTITVRLLGVRPNEISDAKEALPGKEVSTAERLSIKKMEFPPLSVLIVDDDPYALSVLCRRIEHPNLHIDTANNGKEAVEKNADRKYDIILMDLEMPVLDGIGAVAEIRSMERSDQAEGAAIVALSAHDDPETRDRAISAGFSEYAIKPISDEWLISVFSSLSDCENEPVPESMPPDSKGYTAPDPIAGLDKQEPAVLIDADFQDLIPGFLANKRAEIDEIPTLLSREEFDTVRKLGHKLKGSFNIYGFTEPSRLGAGIEKAAEDENKEEIQKLVDDLVRYLDHVVIHFEEDG